ncbi:OsmC family peroxiredoxin [Candidatus Thorarchaeota archaeon]|nr:MAG: OsmC family peroxiredoxin [Candidatus Thorarchaeota archaeon]
MSEEPEYFPVNLVWTGGKSGEISVLGKTKIRTGTLKGNDVEAAYHSPEDLFVASATVCYMNGFVNFSEKMHIDFKAFSCDAIGVLEKVDRSFEITRIEMKARVEIKSEDIRNKIQRALELAAKYCFVGNSMKCPISHETEVVVT